MTLRQRITRISIIITLFCLSFLLFSACSSDTNNSLDEIINSLETSYINGGTDSVAETFISSESGIVSTYKEGAFTLLVGNKTKIKFTFDSTTILYGADSFIEGDTITVSFVDSSDTNHKKPLPASVITVISAISSSGKETLESKENQTEASTTEATVSDTEESNTEMSTQSLPTEE